jgi:hypothetical protein
MNSKEVGQTMMEIVSATNVPFAALDKVIAFRAVLRDLIEGRSEIVPVAVTEDSKET